MRVTLKTSGGVGFFPGLARPIVADTDALEPELSERLRELVENAGFFELPDPISTLSRGAADVRTETLTVEDAARVHEVAAVETSIPEALRELVDFVKEHGTRA
ncbi:protealysin inhibitor emfourin [Pendulispora albinea]|uniref:Uncharacterized protein n=1 Tax=Pendulispora albinea TaxID=2741071 RepID=A0ABZ2LU32_9BACT